MNLSYSEKLNQLGYAVVFGGITAIALYKFPTNKIKNIGNQVFYYLKNIVMKRKYIFKEETKGSFEHQLAIQNPNIKYEEIDYYYHLGLDTSMPICETFHDVKFVLMGGSPARMEIIARRLMNELSWDSFMGDLAPIGKTERYSLFKVGPVIAVSHGMGKPSLLIMLHELAKLLAFAGARNVKFIRTGSSGGVGVDGGVVVVSDNAVNHTMEPVFQNHILGHEVNRTCALDLTLREKIVKAAASVNIEVTTGLTLGTDDFYEGQGRCDGAICDHTEADKMEWLQSCYEAGIRNIEMESDCFAAFCYRLSIPCAIVCCTLLNRLDGDSVSASKETLTRYMDDVITVIIRFLREELFELVDTN